MLISVKNPTEARETEVTPRNLFEQRRAFLRLGAGAALAGGLGGIFIGSDEAYAATLQNVLKSTERIDEALTPQKDITHYNNFYEFSTEKDEVAEVAKNFQTRPWTVQVEGLVNKPGTFDIDTLIRKFPLEERIYRFRCVEAWSMVVPWVGFPLAKLVAAVEPQGSAKYIEFTTLLDSQRMPGQKRRILDWPYVEGLRMDEANHPLTLLAVGLYGEELLPQNGAPIRLVVPWKYGFKNIKSIVKIRFVEQQPVNTWQVANAGEYGFFANVNPSVDHPRWSQARERRIGEFLKRKTLMFNGYADQVASLYAGMDLAKYF